MKRQIFRFILYTFFVCLVSDEGYDVYLYDQIGSGQSDRLENISEYTVDRHIMDLKEIIKKIGSEKIILIGQSWGAILALLSTADNPGKVEKIIFISPGPIFPSARNYEISTLRTVSI